MCGIFALLNSKYHSFTNIKENFMKTQNRGPEYSELLDIPSINTHLGFHRLAINGVDEKKSNQPFFIDGVYLVCNGEIYNHKSLIDILNITPNSRSDCEVIIHLYKRYGMKQTLQMLDGVFAFVLIDTNKKQIFVSRDTYGIRPLFTSFLKIYVGPETYYYSYLFSSELKSISDIGMRFDQTVNQFLPGHCSKFIYDDDSPIKFIDEFVYSQPISFSNSYTFGSVYTTIYEKIYNAVHKRVQNTEREIACLLSGGLDSSLIAALVKKIHKGDLHTWSIGFKGSEDLMYAQQVADHIGSIHHSIEVDEQEFLDAIPQVIYNIESYDTTTVRASVGNWLICKKIKEQSNAKVIFNGDGADEVMGGYLYFHEAPDSIEFDKECRRLLTDIHCFDVLRSDRSISSHGLEARTPFLDRAFVDYYLSIDYHLRCHGKKHKPEKYLIRESIEKMDSNLLPQSVLYRTKEAFSDGVSKQTKSWFQIIQDYVKNVKFSHLESIDEETIIKDYNPYLFNRPKTLEQLYYRDIFTNHFPNPLCSKIIPYFWMPKFVEATDASARTLNVYKEKIKLNK
tara:strand:- start:2223 stop:3920 length:1698 start_codon:yes stop_codon:yes gene_type:complete